MKLKQLLQIHPGELSLYIHSITPGNSNVAVTTPYHVMQMSVVTQHDLVPTWQHVDFNLALLFSIPPPSSSF